MRLAAFGLLAGLMACHSASPTTARIRDSSGVHIVTYEAIPPQADTWHVDSQPELSVSGTDSDSLPLLLDPVGAMRLRDGSLAVADRGASAIKYFDPHGRLSRTVGRPGHGPEEFDYLADLKACGADSVFAYDVGNGLVSVISPAAGVVRQFSPKAPHDRQPYAWSCSRSGVHVMSTWPVLTPPFPSEPFRPEVEVGIARSDARATTTIGRFLGTEMVAWGRGISPRAVGRWLRVTASDSQVWLAENGVATILGYSLSGKLTLELHLPFRDTRVSPSEWEFQRRVALDSAATEGGRQRVTQFFATSPVPTTLPPVQGLLSDPGGAIWVRPHRASQNPNPRWQVYSPYGRLLATVALPASLTAVYEIGDDYILGAQEDADGAPVLVTYALHRGGASGP